jgi:hypothetical protein
MTRYQTLASAIIVCSLCGRAMAGPVEDKWGAPLSGPFGLKQYIVSVLYMKTQPDFEDQKLKASKPTAEFLDNIDVMPFLYAFDSFQSKKDVEDLANLSSYYLGEAAGELYRCLVLRKGEKIKPALKKLAANKSNECIDRFGAQAKICLPDKEYRDTLRRYIETITTLTKTHSTKPGCTTAGWSKM